MPSVNDNKDLEKESTEIDLKTPESKLAVVEEVLASKNYGPAIQRFKSFGMDKPELPERYAVEKRVSPEGDVVVVKSAQISNSAGHSLRTETQLLMSLNLAENAIKTSDQNLKYDIMDIEDAFEEGGIVFLATKWCEDNPELDKRLNPRERLQILFGMAEHFRNLGGAELVSRNEYYVISLLKRALEVQALDSKTLSRINTIVSPIFLEELNSVGQTPVHGDPHRKNLAINQDSNQGLDIIIMDVESAHLGSPFEDLARIQLIVLASEALKGMDKYTELAEEYWLTLGGLSEDVLIESHKVSPNNLDPKLAERYLKTWIIIVALEKLIARPDIVQGPFASVNKKLKESIEQNLDDLEADR